MQILRLQARGTDSETTGVGPSNLCFKKPSGGYSEACSSVRTAAESIPCRPPPARHPAGWQGKKDVYPELVTRFWESLIPTEATAGGLAGRFSQ